MIILISDPRHRSGSQTSMKVLAATLLFIKLMMFRN